MDGWQGAAANLTEHFIFHNLQCHWIDLGGYRADDARYRGDIPRGGLRDGGA